MNLISIIRRKMRAFILYIFAIIITVITSFPYIWAFISSVTPLAEMFRYPPTLLPKHITLDNYITLLTRTHFPQYFYNSLTVATSVTIVTIAVATFGAYSLARLKFRGRDVLRRLILFNYLFPSILLVIPLFIIMYRLHLSNTLTSLILAYTTFCIPISLQLLTNFFETIPKDLEESAMIDGATRVQTIFRITFPLAIPGIISVAIFAFILAWNEYLYALILISSESLRTLPPGVAGFTGRTGFEMGLIMSSIVLMILPVAVAFIFIQDYLTRGITGLHEVGGALKR